MKTKECIELICLYNDKPVTFVVNFIPNSDGRLLEELADEAMEIVRKKYPDIGKRLSWRYNGTAKNIIVVDDEECNNSSDDINVTEDVLESYKKEGEN